MSKKLSLRALLLADSATCAAMSLILGLGATPLATLTGLPGSLLFCAGLSLFPIALFMALVARRCHPGGAALIIAGNLGWVLASLVLLASGWVAPNALGVAFVLVQALAVTVLAIVEWTALRGESSEQQTA